MRLIVGMTAATGAALGIRLLEVLHDLPDVETHLVLSRWARTTIELETGHGAREVTELADVVHGSGDQAASISPPRARCARALQPTGGGPAGGRGMGQQAPELMRHK